MNLVALAIFAISGGCSTPEELSTNGAVSVDDSNQSVDLVFFDFYDKEVVLKINGETVLDQVLDVMDSSTGLSLVQSISIKRRSVFSLTFDEREFEYQLIIDPSVRIIYINPYSHPFVEMSNSNIILLD